MADPPKHSKDDGGTGADMAVPQLNLQHVHVMGTGKATRLEDLPRDGALNSPRSGQPASKGGGRIRSDRDIQQVILEVNATARRCTYGSVRR